VGNWGKTLELVRRQGWEYADGKFIDLGAQEEFLSLNFSRVSPGFSANLKALDARKGQG
jgi:hypothetical protein